MPYSLAPNHPKPKLLFFVSQATTDDIKSNVRDFVHSLASRRQWLNGPPNFVNSQEQPANSFRGDMPIQTVGGYLEIFSVLPPLTLPRQIDLQHLDEVTTLIDAVADFSNRHNVSFELELDGNYVGRITNGKMDRSLSEGLLGEWRRHLGG